MLIFKFFNIWKSEKLITTTPVHNTANPSNSSRIDLGNFENYSRFEILNFETKEHFHQYIKALETGEQERGVYKTVQVDLPAFEENETQKFEFCFRKWLTGILFGNRFLFKINEITENLLVRGLHSIDSDLQAFNEQNIEGDGLYKEVIDLQFSHSPSIINPNAIKYRSHGILVTNFSNDNNPVKYGFKNTDISRMELFEVLLTQIGIWDNRAFNIFSEYMNDRKFNFDKSLSLSINSEAKMPDVNHFRRNFLDNRHSVYIVHLSYIEDLAMKRSSKSEMIYWFWNEYICPENLKGKIASTDNFFKFPVLCLTSGRGNDEWRKQLKNEIRPFVIFRPIESIMNCLSDAIDLKDDFQIKYNLVKLIYGN